MSKPDVKFLAIVAVILLLCAAVPLVLAQKKKMEEFLNERETVGMWFGIGFLFLIFFALLFFRVFIPISRG